MTPKVVVMTEVRSWEVYQKDSLIWRIQIAASVSSRQEGSESPSSVDAGEDDSTVIDGYAAGILMSK